MASDHQKEWGRKLIEDLDLLGSERVLDLGCGDGQLAAVIAELLPYGEVVGIDACQDMIDAARSKAGQNLRFLRMDIDALDFPGEFDAVFSNAALHWVKDHRRLYANVSRALRPGGRLRFDFAGEGHCSRFIKAVREAMAKDRFAACFEAFAWPWHMPAVDAYAAFVAATGLSHAQVWGENADRYFPDTDTLLRWLDQPCLVPFLARVPASEREAFRTVVVERMLETARQADGRCFETCCRIHVLGVK
jgi:trans-aconitate methyltransferase